MWILMKLTMDGVGTLDNDAQLIGVCQWEKGSSRYDLLFYKNPDIYTKTITIKSNG